MTKRKKIIANEKYNFEATQVLLLHHDCLKLENCDAVKKMGNSFVPYFLFLL